MSKGTLLINLAFLSFEADFSELGGLMPKMSWRLYY